jgi:Fe-S-cluster containining protein
MRRIASTPYDRQVDPSPVIRGMAGAWDQVRERFGAYSLIVPGSPAFICRPEACTAHCCHAFSVNLGEAEADRMTRETGMRRIEFLELDDREPIALPLAQPFLLARSGGHCRFLGEDLGCTVYAGRPNACRLYPHFVVFVDVERGRVAAPSPADGRASIQSALASAASNPVPLLLGHVECPGFTGEPLTVSDWRDLLAATYQLQYEEA